MAISINRSLADGAQTATIEFVTTGDPAGETGVILVAGDLNGADGSGDERVRVIGLVVSVANTSGGTSDAASLALSWGGSGDVFCTLDRGISQLKIPFEPTSGFDGNINYALTGNAAATIRLYLEKLHGFPSSRAKFATGL
jgi:hypothetical protein